MHDAVLKAAFEADRARVQSHMASSSTDLTPIQKLHALLDDTVAATPSRWARHGPLGLNGSLKLRFGSVASLILGQRWRYLHPSTGAEVGVCTQASR